MRIRRVATGQDANGKAHVASDVVIEAAAVGGTELALIWAGDEPPRFPLSGEQPKCPDYWPPVGGYRFVIFTVPPESTAGVGEADANPESIAAAQAAMEKRIGTGLWEAMEADHPGMHTSDTIDFEVVLEGEVWLELDDGEEVHLKTGDTFVQNGTRHRWFNRGKVPAKIVVILIGGHPRSHARA